MSIFKSLLDAPCINFKNRSVNHQIAVSRQVGLVNFQELWMLQHGLLFYKSSRILVFTVWLQFGVWSDHHKSRTFVWQRCPSQTILLGRWVHQFGWGGRPPWRKDPKHGPSRLVHFRWHGSWRRRNRWAQTSSSSSVLLVSHFRCWQLSSSGRSAWDHQPYTKHDHQQRYKSGYLIPDP